MLSPSVSTSNLHPYKDVMPDCCSKFLGAHQQTDGASEQEQWLTARLLLLLPQWQGKLLDLPPYTDSCGHPCDYHRWHTLMSCDVDMNREAPHNTCRGR